MVRRDLPQSIFKEVWRRPGIAGRYDDWRRLDEGIFIVLQRRISVGRRGGDEGHGGLRRLGQPPFAREVGEDAGRGRQCYVGASGVYWAECGSVDFSSAAGDDG